MTLQTPTKTVPAGTRTAGRFVKYSFFRVDLAWKRLPLEECKTSKREFLSTLKDFGAQGELRTYSLSGTRGDVDFLVWMIADSVESLQDFHSQLCKTGLGKYLWTPYSYLAMFRPSDYFGKSRDPEPVDAKYLFVYPFTKKREWYGLPFEERRRIMKDHALVGHKYSSVSIHTGYAFGLDDYEFVLSFETDHPEDFLNLVMELRTSEASKYAAIETPIFTCVRADPEKMLDLLGP